MNTHEVTRNDSVTAPGGAVTLNVQIGWGQSGGIGIYHNGSELAKNSGQASAQIQKVQSGDRVDIFAGVIDLSKKDGCILVTQAGGFTFDAGNPIATLIAENTANGDLVKFTHRIRFV